MCLIIYLNNFLSYYKEILTNDKFTHVEYLSVILHGQNSVLINGIFFVEIPESTITQIMVYEWIWHWTLIN